jgi:hypothetical protein
MIDASLTDYERHAMALMSLGLNPYNINNENYIEKIISSFDGKQFGNANEDNDDIFALIVLQNAGYKQEEEIINNDISFVLSRQKENGSWDESVDMTGATIEALSAFTQNEQVKNALLKAKDFLKQSQKEDGGWSNVSSTAWALEGVTALNEKIEDWKKDNETNNTPLDYLASMQDVNGGIKNDNLKNKIWETAYVTSILSGKTWNQIMQKFEKPKEDLLTLKKEIPKTILITKKENKIPKLENKNNLNTANVINAIPNPPIKETAETSQSNWLMLLLKSIFTIF